MTCVKPILSAVLAILLTAPDAAAPGAMASLVTHAAKGAAGPAFVRHGNRCVQRVGPLASAESARVVLARLSAEARRTEVRLAVSAGPTACTSAHAEGRCIYLTLDC